MESRGNTPRISIDTSDLLTVIEHSGPFLTVHLATPGDMENAAQHNDSEWQGHRERLATEGATEDALLAVDDLVSSAHERGASLYAICSEKELLHASYWDTAPRQPMAQWSALPALAPIIELRQSALGYMTVVADRTGADLHVVCYGHEVKTDTVQGDPGDPIRKVNPGGWSQRRFQKRAEDTWEHNAKNTAERIAAMATEHKPRMIFLAGDVRAVQLIQSDLPKLQAPLQVIDGSRAQDSGETISQSQIDHALAKLEMEDTAAYLDKLAEELGQHDRAAIGTAGVVRALQQSQVEVLFLQRSTVEGSTIFVGFEPGHISRRADDLEAMGVDTPMQVSAIDGMIRSALLSSANVRLVEKLNDEPEGVAALLRWA